MVTKLEHGTFYAWRYAKCDCESCVAERNSSIEAAEDRRREQRRNYAAALRAEQHAYHIRRKSAWDERNRRMVHNPRRGHWSTAEDEIVLRQDITTREKSAMLQRSYASVATRKRNLAAADRAECEHCGASFMRVRTSKAARKGFYSRGRFCSRGCVYAWMKADTANRLRRSCGQCGVEYVARARGGKFCSTTCAGASKLLWHESPCEECGEMFKPAWNGRTATRFCSMSCAGAVKRRETRERNTRTCPACGESFVSEGGRRKTCSRVCGAQHRKQTLDRQSKDGL